MSKQATGTTAIEIFAQKGQAAPSVEAQEAAAGGAGITTGKQADLPFPREVESKAPEAAEPPPAGSLLSIDFRRLSDGERNQILSLKANKLPPRGSDERPAGGQPLLPFPMEVRLGQATETDAGEPAKPPALPNWRNLKQSRGKETDTAGSAEPPTATEAAEAARPQVPAEESQSPTPPAATDTPSDAAAETPPDPAVQTAPAAPVAEAPSVAPPAEDAQSLPPTATVTAQETVAAKRPLLGPGAIAALVFLASLGLWLLLPLGEPAEDSTPAEPAVVAPTAEPVAAPAAATAEPEADPQEAAAPSEPADTAEAPDAPIAEPAPSFDLIRVEPNGEAVLAGRAAPHASLIILDNDVPLGTVKADGAGEWAFIPEQPLPPGDHAFSLVVSTPQGEVVLPAREAEPAPEASAPDSPAAQSSSKTPPAPEEPAPDAESDAPHAGDGAKAEPPLPVAKPQQSNLPGIKHYGVQLSSTRSEQSARQEWQLLRERFPTLLGDKSLLIQKAVLQDGGTRYRVRTSLVPKPQAARKLCDALRAQNQDCLVFRE